MLNRNEWYFQIFMMPRLENAIVKILIFILLIQASYLVYVLNSVHYINNSYYLSGDSDRYFSFYKLSNYNDLNLHIKNKLISQYVMNFEKKSNNNFIKNLSSKPIYESFLVNKESLHTRILNIKHQDNSTAVLIKQYSQETKVSQVFQIDLSYSFFENLSQPFLFHVLSYEKQLVK
ncbi:MAG: hypothetical protein AAFO15_00020 [Pseudomonadota bacterium]